MESAQEALDECVNHDEITSIRADAKVVTDEVKDRLAALSERLDDAVDTSELEWPEIELPER